MNFKDRLCAMNCHYRFYELEDFFRSIHAQGIRYAEIWTGPMHYYVDTMRHEPVEKLKRLSEDYQVKIIGICPEQTNPKPNNIAVKGDMRRQEVFSYYRQMIDIACEVGCRQVLVTSGWDYYSEPVEAAWERSVDMMRNIAAYAQSRNILLALEALQPNESRLVNTIADIKRYRKDVGSTCLKVCIDFGAMARAGLTPQDYFEAFGNDIVHIHFVDGNPTGHLAWGDGERDLKQDLQILERYGYPGYLSLETATQRYYEEPWTAEQKTLKSFGL